MKNIFSMKSYTDIEQSKKLAEILPIESADNYYSWHDERYYVVNKDCPYPYSLKAKIPCWSLTALLKTLNFPSLTQNKEDEWEVCVFDHDNDDYIEKTASNPIDACYEMIIKLNKFKML
jgi:hypothetical protein